MDATARARRPRGCTDATAAPPAEPSKIVLTVFESLCEGKTLDDAKAAGDAIDALLCQPPSRGSHVAYSR